MSSIDGIETHLTLRQTDNITSQPAADQTQARRFNVYVLTFRLFTSYSIRDQFFIRALHYVSGNR